jgi:hypothetical protein
VEGKVRGLFFNISRTVKRLGAGERDTKASPSSMDDESSTRLSQLLKMKMVSFLGTSGIDNSAAQRNNPEDTNFRWPSCWQRK